MSIKEDWNRGTKFEQHFNTIASKAFPLVGELRRIAIYELDNTGHAFFASNRPDVAEEAFEKKYFLYQSNWQYMQRFDSGIQTFSTQFGHEHSDIYQDKYKATSVYIREQTDENTQLLTLFNSTNPSRLINAITNEKVGIKKLFKFIKEESKEIIKYHRDHKFNIAEENPNYYLSNEESYLTELDRTNKFLRNVGVLQNESITPREWQCLQLLKIGKSASHTGDILGISRRTVESFFESLKRKLSAQYKSDLLEILE